MTARYGIGVIGGGLVGVCCALALRRDGHEVTLIEPKGVGSGASFGNAGLMSSGGCVPIGMPGMIWKVPAMLRKADGPLVIRWRYAPRIAPWLLRLLAASRPARVEQISIALASLLEAAQAAYRRLLSDEDYDALIARRGLLFPYRSEASFERAAPSRALRARRGVEFQVLGRSELQRMQPALGGKQAMGVYFPEARHTVDPQGLACHLATSFTREKGETLTAAVDAIEIERNGRPCVSMGETRRRFDKIVVAAGAWSRRLAGMCGTRVPLDTERGYHAMLPDPEVEVRVPMISGDHSVAVTPMSGGLRISGTVEFAGLSAPPDYRCAERLVGIAERLLPGLNAKGAQYWMGFRPSLPDSMPVIGPAPRNHNVLYAFGHGHLGVTYAAITGQLIADCAAERRTAVDLGPFSAARF